MLTPMDEYLAHQIVGTFDQVSSSDRRFYDRHFFNIFSKEGDFNVLIGLGVYPNVQVMDGFSLLVVGDKEQRNFRASRQPVFDRRDTRVGPLAIQVVEPLKKLRLMLEDNDFGFSYDITFEAHTPPFERKPQYLRSLNRVMANHCHMSQPGRMRGWLKVDGQTHTVEPTSWWGVRDRSWGWRGGVYGPDVIPGKVELSPDDYAGSFTPMMFDDCYVKVWWRRGAETGEIIYPEGDPRGRVKLVEFERTNVKFNRRFRRWQSCDLTITDAKDVRRQINLSRLCTGYIRGGGYGEIAGFCHGMPMGKAWQGGEVWDLTDPKTVKAIGGLADHMIKCQMGNQIGYGVFEFDDEQGIKKPYAYYRELIRKGGREPKARFVPSRK